MKCTFASFCSKTAECSGITIPKPIKTLAGYPSVDNAVDTIVVHLSDVSSVRYEMGYAASISVMLFAMMAIARIVVGKVLDLLGK